ncbi:MAG TPA: hypothetical protein VGI61_06845 [Parafilimonas sp.]|jgi:mono/diheme cytochrome c family protein
MLKKIIFSAAIFFVFIIIFQGCYYHKADLQYPSTGNSCDTTVVRYSVEIKSILDANCKTCHDENGANTISGFNLYDYSTISSLALDGQFTYGTLLSAVMHVGGAPFMPQSGGQLDQCDMNKIAAWVHNGAPDN